MKVTGIIAEYNPLHLGHTYQLGQAKKLTGADYIVVAMSGGFTQRGTPALVNKYDRARMALACGADLVLELPVRYACSSAEYFAGGAVSLLNRLGCVDALCFGSECGDSAALLDMASRLIEAGEQEGYQLTLQRELKKGLSFPAARQSALEQVSGGPFSADVLDQPNNILGVEYCKALLLSGSPIRPVTLRRQGAGYHDSSLQEEGSYSSATAIRAALREGKWEQVKHSLPERLWSLWDQLFASSGIVTEEDFFPLLRYQLLLLEDSGVASPYAAFADVSPELSNRIADCADSFTGWQDACGKLKTRNLTHSRISRALAHILLELKAETLAESKRAGFPVYLRPLGFSRRALPLLSAIKAGGSSPLLSRVSDAPSLLGPSELPLFLEEKRASHIYGSVVSAKYGTPFCHEYRQQPILVP